LEEHKKDLLFMFYMLVCGILFGNIFREKTPFFFIAGSGALAAGVIAASKGRFMGYWLPPFGAVFLALGMYKWWKTRANDSTHPGSRQ
jgi:CHASE2 domain-containing sensor protein